MFPLKSQVGTKSEKYREEITAERVSAFCRAVGAKDSKIAPPTFMTVFRKAEFDLFHKLGFQLSQVLHAEQEYRYESPLTVGDQVEFVTTLTHVLEKHGGSYSMQFLTFETVFVVERGSSGTGSIPAGKSSTTIVIREQKGAAS